MHMYCTIQLSGINFHMFTGLDSYCLVVSVRISHVTSFTSSMIYILSVFIFWSSYVVPIFGCAGEVATRRALLCMDTIGYGYRRL
jgi:hypothetical protein